jgi:hypothetical protein
MDSHRWKQLDNLLQLVLERAPEERDAYVREVSGPSLPTESDWHITTWVLKPLTSGR